MGDITITVKGENHENNIALLDSIEHFLENTFPNSDVLLVEREHEWIDRKWTLADKLKNMDGNVDFMLVED